MMRLRLTILIIALLITWVKSYGAQNERGLDVNDVAILFYVNPDTQVIYPHIGLGSLISKQTLENQIIAFGKKNNASPFGGEIKNWEVVGLRYDPCAPDDASPQPLCHPQVRLIAQPGLADTAMHMLYRIADHAPQPGDPVISDLREIQKASAEEKVETVGIPLRIHPALAHEASKKTGPVGDKIRAFIKKYCSTKNLEEVTFTTTVGGLQWDFFHGLIENGNWSPAPIHNIPKEAPIQSSDDNGNIFPILPRTPLGLGAAFSSRSPEYRWTKLLLRVENPEKSNSKRVDCASCHVSSKIIAHEHPPDFSNQEGFVNPPGLTGFSEYSQQPAQFNDNVRNFAFTGPNPTISTITANSAAYVANLVNQSQGWDNPSNQDCSSPQVRECFSKKDNTAENCLKLCKPRNY